MITVARTTLDRIMYVASILWRRTDQPGYDYCLLENIDERWHLSGTAIFSERQVPCRLDYEVTCDAGWRSLGGTINGWHGEHSVWIEIVADPSNGWRLNGLLVPATKGCLDLDLSFTPSTNLIPIRRLGLEIGSSSPSPAAWLGFPTLELEPLEQTYCRKGRWSYRCSINPGYSVELMVNAAGLITRYPDRWESIAEAP